MIISNQLQTTYVIHLALTLDLRQYAQQGHTQPINVYLTVFSLLKVSISNEQFIVIVSLILKQTLPPNQC